MFRASIFIIATILVQFQSLYGQGLIPFRQGSKWGFADSTKKIVVKCVFDEAFFPENGFAFVKQKGKLGLYSQNGTEVIAPKYSSIGYFYDGLAVVSDEGKYGYVNIKGDVAIPLKYEAAGNFSKGHARAKLKNKWGFIDTKGEKVTDFEFDKILPLEPGVYHVKKDKFWGLYSAEGKELIPCRFDSIGAMMDGNRLVRIDKKWGLMSLSGDFKVECLFDEIYTYDSSYYACKTDKSYGVINKKSYEILMPAYEETQLFDIINHIDFYKWKQRNAAKIGEIGEIGQHEGAVVCIKKQDKWGIIDTSFNELSPYVYDSVQKMYNIFAVQKRKLWGFIGKDGKTLLNFFRFNHVREEKKGTIAVFIGQACGLIDTAANTLVPCIYKDVHYLNEDYYQVALVEKFGLQDVDGNIVTALKYQNVLGFDDEFALLQTPEKSGLFSYEKKKMLIPAMYDEVESVSEEAVKVVQDHQMGLIGKDGKVIAPMIYTEMSQSINGKLLVQKNNKFGWLDSTGKQVIVCKYDSVGEWVNGRVPAKLKGKWGMIDSTGKILVPFEFKGLEKNVLFDINGTAPKAESPDSALVWVKCDNDFWGVMTEKGRTIIGCKYDSIYQCRINKDLFIVRLGGRYGLVNNLNEEILAPGYSELYEGENGFFIVQQGTRFALFDKAGRPITPFRFQELQHMEGDKYLWVLQDGKRGVINLSGTEFYVNESK